MAFRRPSVGRGHTAPVPAVDAGATAGHAGPETRPPAKDRPTVDGPAPGRRRVLAGLGRVGVRPGTRWAYATAGVGIAIVAPDDKGRGPGSGLAPACPAAPGPVSRRPTPMAVPGVAETRRVAKTTAVTAPVAADVGRAGPLLAGQGREEPPATVTTPFVTDVAARRGRETRPDVAGLPSARARAVAGDAVEPATLRGGPDRAPGRGPCDVPGGAVVGHAETGVATSGEARQGGPLLRVLAPVVPVPRRRPGQVVDTGGQVSARRVRPPVGDVADAATDGGGRVDAVSVAPLGAVRDGPRPGPDVPSLLPPREATRPVPRPPPASVGHPAVTVAVTPPVTGVLAMVVDAPRDAAKGGPRGTNRPCAVLATAPPDLGLADCVRGPP